MHICISFLPHTGVQNLDRASQERNSALEPQIEVLQIDKNDDKDAEEGADGGDQIAAAAGVGDDASDLEDTD